MKHYFKKAISLTLLSSLASLSHADVSFTELPVIDRMGGGHGWMDVSDRGDVVFSKGMQGFLWNREGGVQLIAEQMAISSPNYVSISKNGNVQKFGKDIYENGQIVYSAEGNLSSLSPDGTKVGVYRNSQDPIIVDLETGTETSVAGVPFTNYSHTDFSNDGNYALLSSSHVNFLDPNPFFVQQPNGNLLEVGHPFGSIADLSGDGSTVIGRSFTCEELYSCTLISNPAGTFEISDGNYFPEALNYDGTVAALSYRDYDNNNWRAAIWDSVNGVRELVDLLAAQGIDISGWDQVRLYNMSDNGYFIVGEGTNPQGVRKPFLIDATPQCAPNGLL